MGLRTFLDLTSFYRKFVQHYATFASLLDLLQHKQFTRTPATQQTFKILQSLMEKISTLCLPNFHQLFTVGTDASVVVGSVVLSQANHLIAFFNNKNVSPPPIRVSLRSRNAFHYISN